MRRWLTGLLLGLLLLPGGIPTSAAQVSDPGELDGLVRAVGRYYMGPVTTTDSTITHEYNEAGTPIAEQRPESTPVATPDPQTLRGTVMLAVAVMAFDSDQQASVALDAFEQDFRETVRRDPRLPEMRDLELAGLGDRTVALTGKQRQEGVTVDWVFAAVQDGAYLGVITGQFVGLEGEKQARSILRALVEADVEPGEGEFRQDGTSTGGLWAKLALVDPVLVDGSTVTDFVIYPPTGNDSSGMGDRPAVPRVDLHNPASIAGLETLHMRVYQLPSTGATPAFGITGVFRINAWVLTFDSPERAAKLVQPVLGALSDDITVISGYGSAGATVPGGPITETVGQSGYLSNPSLPPGSGVAQVTRADATVYAVVIYAVETDPEPVAEAMISQMIETPADEGQEVSRQGGASTGGVWEQFPECGDPVLEGLVPVSDSKPIARITVEASPAATPAS